MSKPVILVAEELSPAGLELLAGSFEIRHVDGADHDESRRRRVEAREQLRRIAQKPTAVADEAAAS